MEATEDGIAGQEDAAPGPRTTRIRSVASRFLRLLPVQGVAVSLRAGLEAAQLLYTSDPVVAGLDDLQFTLGEGPCVDAFRQGVPVLVPDLTHRSTAGRWPGFAREATQAGAAAAFAFPLQIGAVRFGTVLLYRTSRSELSGVEVATALLIADELIRVVLEELGGPGGVEPTATEAEPAYGRAEIPQATGMIAVQLRVDIPEALAHLRAAAFTANRPVLDLAEDVIARRVSFAVDPNGVPGDLPGNDSDN